MHDLDCDQDWMKLDEMSNEKLTKQVANCVKIICPLRIGVIQVNWRWNFDVLGCWFRSQKVQFVGVSGNGVFGIRLEGERRG